MNFVHRVGQDARNVFHKAGQDARNFRCERKYFVVRGNIMNDLAREIIEHLALSPSKIYKGFKLSGGFFVIYDSASPIVPTEDAKDFIVLKGTSVWRLTESATLSAIQAHTTSITTSFIKPFRDMPLYAEFFACENLSMKNELAILDSPKNLLHHLRLSCPIMDDATRKSILKLNTPLAIYEL